MYKVNGDFGEVRHFHMPPISRTNEDYYIPFGLNSIGWHKCNELYNITRESGYSGHIFLFSKTDGGILKLGNSSPIDLPANMLTWIKPHVRHSYYTKKGKTWEFYWISIKDDEKIDFTKFFTDSPTLNLSEPDVIFSNIDYLTRNKTLDINEFLIESSRVLSDIYHRLILNSFSSSKKQDELIESIIKRMEENCAYEWTLPDLAKEYFISVPQLIRRFKDITDMSPHEYLINIRLRKAITYLHYTNLTTKEISQKVGFPSVSNFIHTFRELYGTTPNKYRKIQ